MVGPEHRAPVTQADLDAANAKLTMTEEGIAAAEVILKAAEKKAAEAKSDFAAFTRNPAAASLASESSHDNRMAWLDSERNWATAAVIKNRDQLNYLRDTARSQQEQIKRLSRELVVPAEAGDQSVPPGDPPNPPAVPQPSTGRAASGWTGRVSPKERRERIARLTPRMLADVGILIQSVEARRYNDPETAEALRVLRELHAELGALIETVEGRSFDAILHRLGTSEAALKGIVLNGSKIAVVAPAMTIGICHLLAKMLGLEIDTSLAGSVYATAVAAELVGPSLQRPPRA